MQDITVDWNWVDNLKEFIKSLESIEATDSLCIEESKKTTSKLIDKIIIKYNWLNSEDTNKIIKLINQEWVQKYSSSDLLKQFKKFKFDIWSNSYSNFKLIKHSFPFCESFKCKLNLSKDLKVISNSLLFQNGVKSFEFYHNDDIKLYDSFISNIWDIRPKSVWIKSQNFKYKSESNLIDVLSQLPNKMKITFGNEIRKFPISLWFSDTILKIYQSDRDNYKLFEWKSFVFVVNQEYLEHIKIALHKSKSDLDWFELSLKSYVKAEFEDFNSTFKLEQCLKYDSWFPQQISDNESQWIVCVLAKDLNKVKLDSSITSFKNHAETVKFLISKWPKSFSHWLKFPNDFKFLSDIANMYPKNWIYSADIYLWRIRSLTK